MILTHRQNYCEIEKTRILRAPVFKHHISNISPYKVYADNIEMFDAFADTVANFSPISMNIIDYWNKSMRTHDTYVWVPIDGSENIDINDPAFGWRESENHGLKNISLAQNPPGMAPDGTMLPDGFPVATGDGRLFGEGRRSYIRGSNEREDGTCLDENQRFFINPIIGVQDKLAMTYLNNFYSVYFDARQDPTLRHRLLTISKEVKALDPKMFFNKPNNLFTEEKTVANKTFIMKKGTDLGLKYAQKSAYDAELQGPMSRFYMKLTTPAPLEYAINSNVLEDIFEKFVKPLAHPIGFVYDYKSVCMVLGAEDIDHPMVSHAFVSKRIEVNCLCQRELIEASGVEDNTKEEHDTPDEETESKYKIECGGQHQPVPKVFALSESDLVLTPIPDPNIPGATISVKYMQGLWDGIAEDAWGTEDSNGVIQFNILKDIKKSIGEFRKGIHEYTKYIFENNNYLIAWVIQSKVQDEAPKVIIEYYRVDYDTLSGWTKIVTFENDIHCNIADNLEATRESQITEKFSIKCVASKNGDFIMDPNPTGPDAANANGPDVLAPIHSGDVIGQDVDGNDVIKYRGFMTNHILAGHRRPYGGKIVGWSILDDSI